jgi:predicted amidohydrolase
MIERMREPLTIAVAQPACIAFDVAANAIAHAESIRTASARVVVFPELSLTGYEMDAEPLDHRDPRLQPIIQACAETGSLALIGAPVSVDAGRPHIGMLAVDANGATVAYRKQWVDSTESHRFAPGAAPAVLPVDGWRLGLAICKDTGIPQHAADTAKLGMDVYVAGTVFSQDERPLLAERARRIGDQHGVWVALASFAGPTGSGYTETAGCSGVWSPDGTLIAQAGTEPGAIACARLA